MKKTLFALGLATAIALPAQAQAREVTFTTQLNDYGGGGAYLALYLTDDITCTLVFVTRNLTLDFLQHLHVCVTK